MRILYCAAILGIAVLFPGAHGQQTKPADATVFRVSSTLVQVDAVVTDAKGHQVTDLNASDFELYADGQLQTINRFSYVRVADSQTRENEPFRPKDHLFIPPLVRSERRENVKRTIVLMVDDLNLSFESLAFVRYSLLKFIDQQAQPGDLIAICRTGSGSSDLQQFTTDRSLAHSIASRLRWNPNGIGAVSFFEPVQPHAGLQGPVGPARADSSSAEAPVLDGVALAGTHVSQQLDGLRQNTLTVGALGAIDYIIQALHDMPGRKSVILFSDGFGLNSVDDSVMKAMRRLIDRANRSGTVIYTMHTAGLQTGQLTAADNPTPGGDGPAGPSTATSSLPSIRAVPDLESKRRQQLYNSQSGLDYLAHVTGGFAYFNGNDLNWGLAHVLEDQSGYYLLGYYPPSGTFDDNRGERPYHNLKLIVKRKGCTVRSRSGFFGATDEETKPQAPGAVEQLRLAMLSPFDSSALHLRVTPFYSEVPGKGSVVRNLLDPDIDDLAFKKLPNGSSEAVLKLLVAAYGADNSQITAFGYDYKLDLTPDQLQNMKRDGALFNLELKLPRAGAFQIRAAIRDEVSLKTGAAHEYLEIPDIRKKQLALTSVVLANANAPSDVVGFGAAAVRRQFHRGEILQYFCLLENANTKRDSAGSVNASLRVIADGKQIYQGPAKITELPGHKQAVMGQLKIGEALATGDYFLQVVATGAAKHSVANQWTDFVVMP